MIPTPPVPDIAAVVARWAGRLTPVLRLPPRGEGLPDQPAHARPARRGHAHFGALFDDCIEVDAVDPAGSPLGQAERCARRWIDDPARQPFLLLGEFGDGKSFACYRLTRLLASRYLAATRQRPTSRSASRCVT